MAVHKGTGKQRAIKFVNKLALDKTSVKRVYEEIRVLSNIHHPNIVNLIEHQENDSKIVIVMEL